MTYTHRRNIVVAIVSALTIGTSTVLKSEDTGHQLASKEWAMEERHDGLRGGSRAYGGRLSSSVLGSAVPGMTRPVCCR